MDMEDPLHEKIYEKVTIDKDYNILIEINHRYSELNQKTKEYKVREVKEIEKYFIDKNGEIQKGL
jgi:hypothetical protein